MVVLTLARKPCSEGSVAANVLKHGTGGINIDVCRLAVAGGSPAAKRRETARRTGSVPISGRTAKESTLDGKIERRGNPETYMAARSSEQLGRWPANLIFCHPPGCRKTGTTKIRGNRVDTRPEGDGGRADKTDWRIRPTGATRRGYSDDEGLETVDTWDCSPGCSVTVLDAQSGVGGSGTGMTRKARPGAQPFAVSKGWNQHNMTRDGQTAPEDYGDSGGVSRFFKQVHESPEGFRASGDCLCPGCGKEYWEHPHDYGQMDSEGAPILHALCNGDRVKL